MCMQHFVLRVKTHILFDRFCFIQTVDTCNATTEESSTYVAE